MPRSSCHDERGSRRTAKAVRSMAAASAGPAVHDFWFCALTAAGRAGASLSPDIFDPNWAGPLPQPWAEAADVQIQGTSRFANVRAAMGLGCAPQMNDRGCSTLVRYS
jgi:hypothetical protein